MLLDTDMLTAGKQVLYGIREALYGSHPDILLKDIELQCSTNCAQETWVLTTHLTGSLCDLRQVAYFL